MGFKSSLTTVDKVLCYLDSVPKNLHFQHLTGVHFNLAQVKKVHVFGSFVLIFQLGFRSHLNPYQGKPCS